MVNRSDVNTIVKRVTASSAVQSTGEYGADLAEHDRQLAERDRELADRDGQLAVLLPQLSVASFALEYARRERDNIRHQFEQCCVEHEQRMSVVLRERDDLRAQTEQKLGELERERDGLVEERDATIAELRDTCESLERQLREIKSGQAQRASILERRFAEAVGARDTRIAALLGEAHRHEANHRQLVERHDQLRESHDQLATQLEELRDSARKAAADRAEAQRALVHREELLRERTSELEELKRELAAAHAQASPLIDPGKPPVIDPEKPVRAAPETPALLDRPEPTKIVQESESAWTDSFEPEQGDWSRTPPPDAARVR